MRFVRRTRSPGALSAANNRQIGSYFGLVPCQDASADKNRLGHITRDGPPVMRKLICEATWTAIKKCPRFKEFFEQVFISRLSCGFRVS